MAPTANSRAPAPPAARPKHDRAPVHPVIPLPMAQQQQQQRQRKLKLQQEERERAERAARAAEEKKAREQAELDKAKLEEQAKLEKQAKLELEQEQQRQSQAKLEAAQKKEQEREDERRKNAETPSEIPSSPPLADGSSPRTVLETETSASSPDSKMPHTAKHAPAHISVTNPPAPTGGETPVMAVRGGQNGYPATNVHAPLPANGEAPADFVFPGSRNPSGSHPHGLPPRHPPNGALHGFHQSHASNTSITFGYQPSNNPSPAPPGLGPLPQPGLMSGPPFVPFNGPNMGPGEWNGPPGLRGGAGDASGFAPSSAGLNSSNPGSFRGSHSPDHLGEGANFGHHVGPFPPPGLNVAMQPNDGMMSPGFHRPGFMGVGPNRHGQPPQPMLISAPSSKQLQSRMRQTLNFQQSVDVQIVLDILNKPGQTGNEAPPAPVKVFTGHRDILSQSYLLSNFFQSNGSNVLPGPHSLPVMSYHMKIGDAYVTGDSVIQALRTLYALPLDDVATGAVDETVGTLMDKALANLAAGYLLILEPVKAAAAEQVRRLLSWETVERVFAFCLNNVAFTHRPEDPDPNPFEVPRPTAAQFWYGDHPNLGIHDLLQSAIQFVVANFPHDFGLDLSGTVDSSLPRFRRFRIALPTTPAPKPASASRGRKADAAHARAADSVSMPSRSSGVNGSARQATIKSPQLVFGDFAPREDLGHPAATRPSAATTALSQILTSLPFPYLKHILEHPALGHNSRSGTQYSPDARRAVIDSVMKERERVRLEAIGIVRGGVVFDDRRQREAILARLAAPSPPAHHEHMFSIDVWDVLAFKEFSYGDATGKGTKLGRVWTAQHNGVAPR